MGRASIHSRAQARLALGGAEPGCHLAEESRSRAPPGRGEPTMAGWRPMSDHDERLPSWVMWQQRPFPDANLLLLPGRQPALVDSGFVGHAEETAAWVRAHTGDLALAVNTHWHS